MRCSVLIARLAALFLASPAVCLADKPPPSDPATALLFTSFRGNGEDGLHLAWSNDGYAWTPLTTACGILCHDAALRVQWQQIRVEAVFAPDR